MTGFGNWLRWKSTKHEQHFLKRKSELQRLPDMKRGYRSEDQSYSTLVKSR